MNLSLQMHILHTELPQTTPWSVFASTLWNELRAASCAQNLFHRVHKIPKIQKDFFKCRSEQTIWILVCKCTFFTLSCLKQLHDQSLRALFGMNWEQPLTLRILFTEFTKIPRLCLSPFLKPLCAKLKSKIQESHGFFRKGVYLIGRFSRHVCTVTRNLQA